MARFLSVWFLVASALAVHWYLLALGALGASGIAHTCVNPCPPFHHHYDLRTALVFLPEILLVGGIVGMLIRRTATWRGIGVLAGATVVGLAVVGVAVLAYPSLMHAAPPDPVSNAWR